MNPARSSAEIAKELAMEQDHNRLLLLADELLRVLEAEYEAAFSNESQVK